MSELISGKDGIKLIKHHYHAINSFGFAKGLGSDMWKILAYLFGFQYVRVSNGNI